MIKSITKYNPLPGDIFVSTTKWSIINFVQKLQALDKKATYGHAGIIINHQGDTLEALSTVRKRNIFDFKGKQVLIGRPKGDVIDELCTLKRDYEGNLYPVHRLFLFLLPPFFRVSPTNWAVCSEFAALLLYRAGLIDFWEGVMPDDLEEMIKYWKIFDPIFEGKIKAF